MNKNLFRSPRGPMTDTINEAGGAAYQLSDKEALAQMALTGCFGQTYYSSPDAQLDTIMKLCAKVPLEYVAKLALYARHAGYMKDTPAALLAYLHGHAPAGDKLLALMFPRIITNLRMLRGFVQMVRSGQFGRKSFGTAAKRLIRNWLDARPDDRLLKDSIGAEPSLADIIKMVHPCPKTKRRSALYAYLIGREYTKRDLPELARAYETFKKDPTGTVPDLPFQMIASIDMSPETWREIAKNAGWMMTRMNLNTFKRHGVFDDPKLVKMIAKRLADPQLVREAKAFPYQLMMAYRAAVDVPTDVREALQDAMEVAIENVPKLEGRVFVAVDVSGSMTASVTGGRKGSTSQVTCGEAAALMASAILRVNKSAEVLAFDTNIYDVDINPRDTVITNAKKLAIHGGGTDCSVVLRGLNQHDAQGDAVIYLSDNQSWFDGVSRQQSWMFQGGTTHDEATLMQEAWRRFKKRNPHARLVCIDLAASTSTQAKSDPSILNVGGFGDQVFDVVADFLAGKTGGLVGRIEAVNLAGQSSEKADRGEELTVEKEE